jgi:hypothetical protein
MGLWFASLAFLAFSLVGARSCSDDAFADIYLVILWRSLSIGKFKARCYNSPANLFT